MEWNINQNGEVVITQLPEKGEYSHVLEFIASTVNPSVYKAYVNRTETLVFKLPDDGLYKHYILLSNRSEEELYNICKNGLDEFLKIMNDVDNSIGYPEEELDIFSIHNLRQCVIKLEKQSILEFIQMYKGRKCQNSTNDKSVRDMLLIAIFVLENLLCQEKYTEAQMIVDGLSSCAPLCNINKLLTCNCNG